MVGGTRAAQVREQLRARSVHFSLVVALCMGIVTFHAQPAVAAAPDPSLKAVAKQLLQVINADRAKLHVRPLVLDKRQSTCSQRHSRHMAVTNSMTHDQFPADICVTHVFAGENIGVAAGDPLTAVLSLNTTMMDEGACPTKNCPGNEFADHGHYMNLVNPGYTRIGIGIVVTNGSVWLTENFTG